MAVGVRNIFIIVAVILLGLAMNGALAIHHTGLLVERGLHEGGVPYVGNNDGYYHLDNARTLAHEGKGLMDVFADSRQSMFLSYLLAGVAGTDTAARHQLAAYLGPLLGLSMLLAVLPWGFDCRSRFVALTAPLLALLAPYWVTRTHVGFLDTDSLVPGLCLFALFCVYRFVTGTGRRWTWIALYVLVLCALWLWWRQGAALSAGFLLILLVYPSKDRAGQMLKLAFGIVILCVVGLSAFGVEPLAGYAASAIIHVKLAFGGAGDSLLSSAISELGGMTVEELGRESLGSPWMLLPAVAGTILYCLHEERRAIFLVAGWAFGAAALIAQRFIPLFIPVAAFFAVYGVATVCSWGGQLLRSWAADRGGVILSTLCVPLLFFGVIWNCLTYEPESYFSRSDYRLAETVRSTFPSETLLWTWWDYGYFFQYVTGMDTYFDGGSQTDVTCFVAAHPLMHSDMDRAADWMRHFSVSSWKQLDLTRRGTEWSGYIKSFEQDIAGRAETGLPVALVLPSRVYTTTGYLYVFAHVFDEVVPPVTNHLDLFPKAGFEYEPGGKSVVVPEVVLNKGYESFGAILDATGKSPAGLDLSVVPDPYLVFSDTTDFLAVTDRHLVETVLFRLLGLLAYDTKRFEPVDFDYRFGGVWRVR